MAQITINASAGGGWYGSVTVDSGDSPEACEAACQLLEKLLGARTKRAAQRAGTSLANAIVPSSDARETILARLQEGPKSHANLLAGLKRGSASVLTALCTEHRIHLQGLNYVLGPSPRLPKDKGPEVAPEA